MGVKELYLDTETTGLRWFAKDLPVGISYCLPDGQTGYLPFGHRPGGNLPEAVVKEWAERELRDIHLVFFNGPFDINNFYVWGVDLEEQGCTVSDVGLSAALLDDHRTNSSLASISWDYLRAKKVEGIDVTRIAEYHAGDVEKYARQDAWLVRELKRTFQPLLEAEDLLRVQKLEDDCIYATCEMERNGAPLDEEKLHRWLVQSERDYIQSLYDLHKVVGFTVNPGSKKDLENVFRKFQIPFPTIDLPGHKFGKVSFEKRYIANIDHPVVKLIRHAKRLASVRSKYLIPYSEEMKKHGRLFYALIVVWCYQIARPRHDGEGCANACGNDRAICGAYVYRHRCAQPGSRAG
jgi:DNA polymerase I-like protein with 3'-5' exonuclease and polymerase domains